MSLQPRVVAKAGDETDSDKLFVVLHVH